MKALRNHLLITVTVLCLVGCFAGWSKMTGAQKWQASITYYRLLSTGLSIAADTAAIIMPSMAPAVAAAKLTVAALDAAANRIEVLVQNNAGEEQIMKANVEAARAATNANGAVGVVTEAAGIAES